MSSNDWEYDVVLVFFEFQDELDSFKLVEDAEVDGGGGAEEIHRFSSGTGPGINVLEVKASFFLLQKYSHCAAYTAHRVDGPYPSDLSDVFPKGSAKPVQWMRGVCARALGKAMANV